MLYTLHFGVYLLGPHISRQREDDIQAATKVKKFFDDKPTFANRVRMVHLSISFEKSAWLFMNPNFTSNL